MTATILLILKVGGLVISAFAALWSTTQTITTKDEHGAKSLTFEGRILVGVFILSLFVSLSALGIETIKSWRDAEVARLEKAAQLAQEAAERAEAEAQEQRREDDRRLDVQLAAFERLENQTELLRKLAEQEARDTALSLQLAREAESRAAEAERALTQLVRINSPLRTVSVTIRWRLDTSGYDVAGLWDLIEAEQFGLPLLQRSRYDRLDDVIAFAVRDLPEPEFDTDILFRLAGSVRDRVRFCSQSEAVRGRIGSAQGSLVGFADGAPFDRGDCYPVLSVDPRPSFQADFVNRTLWLVRNHRFTAEIEGEFRPGEKMSLDEFRRLAPVIEVRPLKETAFGRHDAHILDEVRILSNDLTQINRSSLEEAVPEPIEFVVR